MHELKTNTAARIVVGPLPDPTDGKTAETALDVTALSVQMYQIKTDGTAVVRTQFAPTASGGDNDMVHVTDDTAGVYDLELTAAQLNFLGNARITFYDVDGFLVHYIDIQVVSAAYFDWKYGTTTPEMNLADDAITAAKYDESTAYPLKSADTGATALARAGADGDTLETLSDQIDDIPTVAEFEARTLVSANYGTAANQATIAAYIDTEITSIEGKVDTIDTNMDTLLADWTDGGRLDLILDSKASASDVNDQVVDALATDTYAEPGQGAPPATASLAAKINYLFKSWRNKLTNDGSNLNLYNDAGDTVDQKASIGESGGTVTRGEFGTGA